MLRSLHNSSLIALACGDSYGSHYECEGLSGYRFALASLPDKPKYPKITDDTKMATILLNHYKKYKTIQEDILTKEYREWALKEGDSDGIGIHTKDILLYDKRDKNSQGNGALMRNIPFGVELIKDGFSFDDAVTMMNRDSAITHKNSTIFMANRVALDLAINGIAVLDKAIYKSIVLKLHQGRTAWIIHSLYRVIEALKKDVSFLDAFRYIVSFGGDTDTNCAIYGGIKGYKNNIENELFLKDFLS